MKKEIGQRIALFRKHEKLSQQAFADSVEASKESIGGYERGSSAPGGELLAVIAKSYPELNIRWLLTGEGDMILSNEDNPLNLKLKVNGLEVEIKKLWAAIEANE